MHRFLIVSRMVEDLGGPSYVTRLRLTYQNPITKARKVPCTIHSQYKRLAPLAGPPGVDNFKFRAAL